MSRRGLRASRQVLFVGAAGALAWALAEALAGLPRFGAFTGAYGQILNALAVPERHVTNVVGAVLFDFRALDTFGEELILFAAVVGVSLLLRPHPDEDRRDGEELAPRPLPPPSDALRVFGPPYAMGTAVAGAYLATHGHLTPGGGFQGGAVIASAVLLLYLTGGYEALDHAVSTPILDAVESTGIAAYALFGLAAVVVGAPFLANVLPLGDTGSFASGGTIFALDVAVGVAVAGGLTVLLSDFVEQTELLREGARWS